MRVNYYSPYEAEFVLLFALSAKSKKNMVLCDLCLPGRSFMRSLASLRLGCLPSEPQEDYEAMTIQLFIVGFISIFSQVAILRELSVAYYGVELGNRPMAGRLLWLVLKEKNPKK